MSDDIGTAAQHLRIRRTRRTIHALTAVALLISAAVGSQAVAASRADTPPPTTADQEKGMTPGLPFRDPVDADAVASPNVTINLGAAQTSFSVSGRQVWGESYNGAYVAPTIRVLPGSTLTVNLVNHLPVATNLHFHGLHVSPQGQSDDPFLCVAPGASTTYQLVIPADHPQGTFWYHSHAMGTSCPAPGSSGTPGMGFMPGDVEDQIFAGLSGALVVGDDRKLLPGLHCITAHTFVLKDMQLDSSGHILQNTGTTSIDSNAATVRLVNGQLRPVLSLKPNETQLWRLVNAGADIFYQLHLDGYRFTVVGEDGTPVAQVTTADSLVLPPAKRYDVLVTANGTAGQSTTLRTTAYSNGPQGDQYPDTPLVKVKTAGTPVPRLPLPTGGVPTAPADLASAAVVQRRSLDLSESADGLTFYINGKQFSADSSVFDTPAKVNTVEEWTITNEAGEDHPFHLHTNAFQVMSVNGVTQPYTHRQDIVPIPHAENGVPGKVVIRVAFADYPGQWMFHCHIAAHEDHGMMSFINVVS